jgi:benzoyl-CoA reductase/2-hydroxyglutaryl-CoA dehydratase subunit BcrC/BadD/HgdB
MQTSIGTILYTCPFVPAEWITSHGFRADRIIPESKRSNSLIIPLEGVCSYVRAFANTAVNNRDALAIVVTTVCDQMRRVYEIIARQFDGEVFLLNVPSTWQHSGAKKLYLDELKRLGRFLVALGGKSPSNDALAEIMFAHDRNREEIRAAKLLAGGIPLAIVGGPLVKEDFELFDIIEQLGGEVVLDATETGELGMCRRFDQERTMHNPMAELAEAYLCGIADASRRPNNALYRWLGLHLSDRRVHGIIFRRYIWCDIWHAELYRLKEWTSLPVLSLDVDTEGQSVSARTRQQLCAFMEMLK